MRAFGPQVEGVGRRAGRLGRGPQVGKGRVQCRARHPTLMLHGGIGVRGEGWDGKVKGGSGHSLS